MWRTRKASCRMDAWQLSRLQWQEEQERTGAGHGDPVEDDSGPPTTGYALLPWLLLGLGAFSNIFQGNDGNPLIEGAGLLTFNSLYIYVVLRAFIKEKREEPSTKVALVVMTLLTCGLAGLYGEYWMLFFPLLGLAAGATARGPWLLRTALALTVLSAALGFYREGWGGLDIAYATFISTMVTAAILSLSEAVRELRAARGELARRAVEKERLRFSRDLHDLLGHTLSVIVVKSEAARRLAPRDLDAALGQITDIESVGRQALTEIREAVTGYRRGSLTVELDRAHSALTAAGIRLSFHRSGPALPAQSEALLSWVVREAVTNAVRHSAATTCEIALITTPERAVLTVTDDGHGAASAVEDAEGAAAGGAETAGGTGLRGLTERLAAAGGSLDAGPVTGPGSGPGSRSEPGQKSGSRSGPGPRSGGGWVVTADLPLTDAPATPTDAPSTPTDAPGLPTGTPATPTNAPSPPTGVPAAPDHASHAPESPSPAHEFPAHAVLRGVGGPTLDP
ncbi:histidine kinase [Streptomyces sp. NPDC088387]|uniref:sensor histidine kinase n=1 Tax=Streptomyces sp. NPDC088387 TaxID=3365859 RepID=UPI0037F5E6F6